MVTLFKKKDKSPTLSTKFAKLVVDKLEGEDNTCITAADGREVNLTVDTFKENGATVQIELLNECTTPTGKEYRIPESLICPPAPRTKKKRKVSSSSSNVDAKEYKEYVPLPEIEAVLALNHASSSKIAWSTSKKRC